MERSHVLLIAGGHEKHPSLMTWVIGVPSLFTGSIALADVQVTLDYGNGRTEPAPFAVRKLQPVTRWVLMGFSGSVEIGLCVSEDAQRYFGVPNGAHWPPGKLAFHWARRLKWLWPQFKATLRDRGLEVMLLGGVPQKNLTGPAGHAYILRSPRFEIERMAQMKPSSIGSGSALPQYVAALQRIVDAEDPEFIGLVNVFARDIGQMPWSISHLINDAIEKEGRDPGISRNMHLGWVRFGHMQIDPNDTRVIDDDGEHVSLRMPSVATCLGEFYEMAKGAGIATAACVG